MFILSLFVMQTASCSKLNIYSTEVCRLNQRKRNNKDDTLGDVQGLKMIALKDIFVP